MLPIYIVEYDRLGSAVQAWVNSLLNRWKKIRFWLDAIAVVRLNGVLVLAVAAGSLYYLGRPNPDFPAFFDPESFFETFALLLLAVIGFYLAAVVLPYLWFFLTHYLLRGERNQILFKFPRETCVFGEEFAVDAILQRKMRLLFGAIKFRLVFLNYDTTDWYFMMRSQKRRGVLFQSAERGAVGSFAMRFRHLGRFRTRYSVVKFEDPLGLFSFPIIEKEYDLSDPRRNFYIYSVPQLPAPEAAPFYVLKRNVAQSSEQTNRVAEDFFDTKQYEPSDDSRRLMWKVFSRTRQLLVRIPDRDSSIDADIDIYLLFYNSMFTRDNEPFRTLYDAYINEIGAFLQTLMAARPLNVHIHCDTQPHDRYEFDTHLGYMENLKRGIVSNYWHRHIAPAEFLRQANAQRSPDRERMLIVNPYIDPAILPQHEMHQFTLVRMLGTEVAPQTSSHGNWLVKPERPERAALKTMLAKGFMKRLARNREALGAVLPDGGRHGSY